MLCLPYTTGDGCPSGWHYHFSDGSADGTYAVHTLMSGECQTHKVEAILTLLSTESTITTLACNKSENWAVIDALQALTYYTPRYWKPVVTSLVAAFAEKAGFAGQSISYDDIYCKTCNEYVNKTIDRQHWDDLCGTCSHHEDECDCCKVCGYDPCECCAICHEGPSWSCECCSYCEQTAGNCECETCRNCGYKQQDCGCYSDSTSQFGNTKVVPWAARADLDEPMSLPKMADCENSNIDPIQAAADFYLLDAIKNTVRASNVTFQDEDNAARFSSTLASVVRSDSMLSALTQSAERSYRNLVDYLAPNFLAYALPAVGGELRYHNAVGKAFKTGNREGAWDKFVDVVAVKGAETLFEADKLFNEFGGGAYGGKKWGDAAKVVGQYLAGTMPAWLFVDRVFTLQHNGGCFLNKVNWARTNKLHWGLSKILYVLNAHAGKSWDASEDAPTDWRLLLTAASPEVASMFTMTERHLTRIARRFGGTLEPVPVKSHIRSHV